MRFYRVLGCLPATEDAGCAKQADGPPGNSQLREKGHMCWSLGISEGCLQGWREAQGLNVGCKEASGKADRLDLRGPYRSLDLIIRTEEDC